MSNIEVKNNTDVDLLFSVFKQGDAAIPFFTDWIKAGKTSPMKIGDFNRVGVGVQVQEGGRWVSDPRNGPAFQKNEICNFTISKEVG